MVRVFYGIFGKSILDDNLEKLEALTFEGRAFLWKRLCILTCGTKRVC
jgi:hypothetical protein